MTLHRKLIKEGAIIHDFENDENILCVLEEDIGGGIDVSTLNSLKEMYDEKLQGTDYHAVIGRGMYKGYLVKKKKRKKYVDNTDKKLKEVVKQVHKKMTEENVKDIETLEEVCITNTKNKFDSKNNYNGKNKYYIEL